MRSIGTALCEILTIFLERQFWVVVALVITPVLGYGVWVAFKPLTIDDEPDHYDEFD